MEPFLKKFFSKVYTRMIQDKYISNYCKFDSQLLTLFTSSLYLAGLITSLYASFVTKSFGRKASMLVGGAAFLLGATHNGVATNIYMLIFGRVLLGVGVGFTNQSVPLYLSKMALPKHRGAISNGFQLCIELSIKEIREATLKLRESGSGKSTSPGPFDTWSESEATVKKKKKSAHGEIKLPGKYELLDDFFNGLDSSIQLLQLKRLATFFSNVRPQVETLTDRCARSD